MLSIPNVGIHLVVFGPSLAHSLIFPFHTKKCVFWVNIKLWTSFNPLGASQSYESLKGVNNA